MIFKAIVMTCACAVAFAQGTEAPTAEIDNGQLHLKLYLPDATRGYYRGTRFDWSGAVYSLKWQGHEYYGPWFDKKAQNVRDFIYEGNEIIVGPCSGTTGPVDEFGQIGFDAAKPGGTFLKIGVGALRKTAEPRYSGYQLYEIANGGKWTVRKRRDRIEFTQRLNDAESGYGYVYRKVMRLVPGKPEMVLEHGLKNIGRNTIDTTVYNHNFVILDGKAPGEGLTIETPFDIKSSKPPNAELAQVSGKRIAYLKTLAGRDTVAGPIEGFGAGAGDHRFKIENSKLGIGVSFEGDKPLDKIYLWSIRSVMSVEPFVAVKAEPGREFTWKATYRYYATAK
ncbi:MAG: hypothetical protein U0Q16_34530 [Bryobacteraceae bacterium]